MKWEYKVLHIDAKGFLGSKVVDEAGLEQKLSQFGEKGWELVTLQQQGFQGVKMADFSCVFGGCKRQPSASAPEIMEIARKPPF